MYSKCATQFLKEKTLRKPRLNGKRFSKGFPIRLKVLKRDCNINLRISSVLFLGT